MIRALRSGGEGLEAFLGNLFRVGGAAEDALARAKDHRRVSPGEFIERGGVAVLAPLGVELKIGVLHGLSLSRWSSARGFYRKGQRGGGFGQKFLWVGQW